MNVRIVVGAVVTALSLMLLVYVNGINLLDRNPFYSIFAEKVDNSSYYIVGSTFFAVDEKFPEGCEIRAPGIYELADGKATVGFYSKCERATVRVFPGMAIPKMKNCLSAKEGSGWRFMKPTEQPGRSVTLSSEPGEIISLEAKDLPFRDCVHSFEVETKSKRISFSEWIWEIEVAGLDTFVYRGNAAETTASVVERSSWTDNGRRHSQFSVYYSSRILATMQSIFNILLSVVIGAGAAFVIEAVTRSKREILTSTSGPSKGNDKISGSADGAQ